MSKLQVFVAGLVAGALAIGALLLFVRFASGPPNGGIDMSDALSIIELARDDLSACEDTVSQLRTNLQAWKVEVHLPSKH